MSSGQGVLWIILWICLNSELLRYHGVQNFAKTIQKMQNSLTLRQQHFLYQRKNLYNLDEVLQARQYQRMIIKSPGWSFYVHPPSPDFI